MASRLAMAPGAARASTPVVVGVVSLLGGAAPLLARMRADLDRDGRLRTSTAVWMWSAYAGYGTLVTAALVWGPGAGGGDRLRLPVGARAATTTLVGAGTGLCVAGMRRFAGPGQLTGTDAGDLVTGGVYACSRNPQYTGALLALAGLAAARRSGTALALTAALAVVYRAWVPVEEQHLTRHFGDLYSAYRATTRRWLGPPASRAGRGAGRQG